MENACPKCGALKSGDSCPKCGLVFSKFNPAMLSETVSPDLQDLWLHVEQHWSTPAAHALFAERAFFLGRPDFAAKCYRKKAGDPIAALQTARIQTRLEQTLLASKTAAPASPHRAVRYVPAFLFILLCLVVTFLALK